MYLWKSDSTQAIIEEADKEIADRQDAENKNTDLILKLTGELEAKDKLISKLRNAPIDGEFLELDAVCKRFNNGEFDLASLICKVWNTSIAVNNKGEG